MGRRILGEESNVKGLGPHEAVGASYYIVDKVMKDVGVYDIAVTSHNTHKRVGQEETYKEQTSMTKFNESLWRLHV